MSLLLFFVIISIKKKKMKSIINKSQYIKSFEQDGFVILKNLIPKSSINNIKKYAADLLDCNNSSFSILGAMEQLEKKSKKYFYEFCIEMGKSPPPIKIAMDDQIFNIVRSILKNNEIYLHDSAVFFNKLSVKRLQYDWHQERSYFPKAKEVITLWYPWLHKVNKENGTMVIAKGGHIKSFDNKRINVKDGLTQMKIPEELLFEFEKFQCNLNLGDAILFSFKSPHKTGYNSSGKPRTTIITRFTDKKGKYNNGWVKSK